jgi:hypothetical protein
MKEQEQSLPLLEDEILNSRDRREGRHPLFSSRFRHTSSVVILGLYSLLVTGILLFQNLSRTTTNAPYCKMQVFAKREL